MEDLHAFSTIIEFNNDLNCTVDGDCPKTNGTVYVEPSPNTTNGSAAAYDLIPDIGLPVYLVIIYSIAYGIIFLFALFGNVIVVIVVCRTRRLHTLTNFFIVNLAVADMLVAVFCVPITLLDNLYNGWRYGALLCKATPYLQGVSVCASVNFLAAIAADRYLAICFTLEHKMTWRIGKIIVCLIWLMSFTIMIPWVLYHKHIRQDQNDQIFYFCVQEWPIENGAFIFYLVVFVVCYLIPLILIVGCYFMIALRVSKRNAPGIFRYSNVIQRSKVRVIKMLALIVFLFAVSWLPLYVIFLLMHINPNSAQANVLINILAPIAQWLSQSNSGMNPIIYCFFSKTIRKRTVAMLACTSLTAVRRPHSRFSSTKLMSVDYSNYNGQITLRLNKRRCDNATIVRKCNNNCTCESTFYD